MIQHRDIDEVLMSLGIESQSIEQEVEENSSYRSIWNFGKENENTRCGIETEVDMALI